MENKVINNKRLYTIFDILRTTWRLQGEHDSPTLGAALSYYMIFSIAPVILIVITIVGAVLGPHAVQGEIKDQIQDFLGSSGAAQMENLIKSFYHPGKSTITTIVAIVLLVVGATSVFNQLRTSLNTIWEVKPHVKLPIVTFFLSRLFSFGMIICLAFLLLVSLVVHAGVTAVTNFMQADIPGISGWLIAIFHHSLSIAASTVLFAFVFKYLSDATLKWSSVWEGALFTAFLFAIGKHAIALYIGTTHVATTYGAVGSGVMILIWVFYSSQIVFFGAQFTRALAMHRGYSLDPDAMHSHQEASDRAALIIQQS